jgi:CspA family cold shock protein
MHPAIRLATAAIIGAAAWAASNALPQLHTLALFVAAAVAAALLPASARHSDKPARTEPETPASNGPREAGTVKWFNVSKGFGFITKESGEEIFVHFRSIRGDGRRALRDGQDVTFVEAQTEKGPQAEDVEPL